jgi:hypothetical protein
MPATCFHSWLTLFLEKRFILCRAYVLVILINYAMLSQIKQPMMISDRSLNCKEELLHNGF